MGYIAVNRWTLNVDAWRAFRFTVSVTIRVLVVWWIVNRFNRPGRKWRRTKSRHHCASTG